MKTLKRAAMMLALAALAGAQTALAEQATPNQLARAAWWQMLQLHEVQRLADHNDDAENFQQIRASVRQAVMRAVTLRD